MPITSDILAKTRSASKAEPPHGPIAHFALLTGPLMIGVAVAAEVLFAAFVVPVVLFLIVCGLCLRGLNAAYPHTVFGACNAVTLLRAAGVCVLAGAIFAPAAPWAVFFMAVLVLVSDGIDGWLARRSGLSSAFGARFDMETDALLGAVLALVLLGHGVVGPAILVLGFTRYVFVVAGLIWPALRGALPESYRRKTICVIQIGALIMLIFPLTPVAGAPYIATSAAGLLLYSFAVDAWTLVRRGA